MGATELLHGVWLTPLAVIGANYGEVRHGLTCRDAGFAGFGEVYFSTAPQGAVKAWKRHCRMTLNLVVPTGRVRFVLYDPRPDSATVGEVRSVALGPVANYQRLTVTPGLWLGFQGLGDGENLVMNLADMPHDPDEAERLAPDAIAFNWELEA